MKKLYLLTAAMLLLVLAVIPGILSGCGKPQRQELNLVTAPFYPPFEYYVGDKLTGIDIEMMQEIAARLNYKLKIHTVSFDKVLRAVESGQADAGVGSISITEKRKKEVDFSVPYIFISQRVLVPEKSPIQRIEELKGKIIGAQADTTCEAYVKEKYGNAVTYPNIEVAAEALSSGRIDALVVDNLPAEDIMAQKQCFRLLPEKLTEESYGIAVNSKQPELRKEINRCLTDMFKTGWIKRCVKRHVNRSGIHQQESVWKMPQLKIGIVPSYPPYETKENGVFEGIDVDIIQRICRELGYAPLFVEISSDTVYQSISDDDVTVSISSLTITEERKKKVNFSIPYSEVSQRILVKRKSHFRKKEDLKGKSIGVVTGTTSEEQGLLVSSDVERYSEPGLMLNALEKGEVAAIVLDDIILKQMIMHSNEFRLLPDMLIKEEYGIAVSKKEPELLEKINKILHVMKQDGTLAKIHAKHISRKSHSSD